MQNWYDASKETDEAKWTKPDKATACLRASLSGDVAALLRSHMIGLLPFESTIEQTAETMPLSLTQ